MKKLVLLMALVGCATTPEDDGDAMGTGTQADTGGLVEGSPQARAVLEIASTYAPEVLERDLQITARIVDNIAGYRLGDDGIADTADDERFDTLAELDAVPFVGPVQFQQMLEWAIAHGLVINRCTTDGDCAGGSCVLERCVRVTDRTLPVSMLDLNPTSLALGVPRSVGAHVQIATNTYVQDGYDPLWPSSLYGRVWNATLDAGVSDLGKQWTGSVGRVLDPQGNFVDFAGINLERTNSIYTASGIQVCPGDRRLTVQSVATAPEGDLVAAAVREVWNPRGNTANLVLCRKVDGAWRQDIIETNVQSSTGNAVALRFDAAGRPEVLRNTSGAVIRYRNRLGGWERTVLASDSSWGQAFKVARDALTTHVFHGWLTYDEWDPSHGILHLAYLAVTDDGLAKRIELPIGGKDAWLADAAVDNAGNAYALVRGRLENERSTITLIQVRPDGAVVTSVVGSLVGTLSNHLQLGVDASGAVYVAAASMYTSHDSLLRVLAPQ